MKKNHCSQICPAFGSPYGGAKVGIFVEKTKDRGRRTAESPKVRKSESPKVASKQFVHFDFQRDTFGLSVFRTSGLLDFTFESTIVNLFNFYIGVLLWILNKLKMKVEIWSDVMCPFCYIGKRRFEKALNDFSGKNAVEVVWKSFQLNPQMKTEPGKNINEWLAEAKGITIDQARQMNNRVTEMAKAEGLNYDFDKAVVANSFDAHRLVQLAKTEDKGDKMEEALFEAYFTKGQNIADKSVLKSLAVESGLNEPEVEELLSSDEFSENVEQDIYEAQQIGVRGVPYFVLNDRYAVSGAQSSETFAGALEKAFGEWEKEKE